MNKNAKKLVEALRSGEYKQGRGRLKNGDAFCCLGVACDIYGKENGVSWDGGYFLTYHLYLPPIVQAWLGFRADNGSFALGNDDLSLHNDAGDSFEQIADIIESEPEGLFA